MNLQDLIGLAEEIGACKNAIDKAKTYSTLEEALEDPYAHRWACWIRCNIEGIPEDIKRKAEEKACENAESAGLLRTEAEGLSYDIKRKAEQKVCKDPDCVWILRSYVKDMHPDTKAHLKKLGV